MKSQKVICTVTNDLNQDQRMHRICGSLVRAGLDVTLVGRSKTNSLPLLPQAFKQKRLFCFFEKGFLFYAEYNLRLFFYLLFHKAGFLYSVDLDTILPVCAVSGLKRKKFVFDAHEYFTETPEILNRNLVKTIWKYIGNICVPHADLCFTVNNSLAVFFKNIYQKPFLTIYNVPVLEENENHEEIPWNPFIILYQGVLNQGRGLEEIISAMPELPGVQLMITGEGDLSEKLRTMTYHSSAADRIRFTGWLHGKELQQNTQKAHLGLNLLSGDNKNYFYSLANKMFDYIHAGIPALHMDFPEYRKINENWRVGFLVKNLDITEIVNIIKIISSDREGYLVMKQNIKLAKNEFNWEMEEKKLLQALENI